MTTTKYLHSNTRAEKARMVLFNYLQPTTTLLSENK